MSNPNPPYGEPQQPRRIMAPPPVGQPIAPPLGQPLTPPQQNQPQSSLSGYPQPAIPQHQVPEPGPSAIAPTQTPAPTPVTVHEGSISTSEVQRAYQLLNTVNNGYSHRMVGQEALKRSLLVSLLAGGHILLESVPGLAKTTAAHSLAATVAASFKRIQCTPDLLPSDIIGTQIWNQRDNSFDTKLGPVHANFVLLDEINRSSAKTQSAMLEAMQERQTSIGGVEHKLPDPFFVIATQNPIEQEGTYHLPEAQLDRFLLKDIVDYPNPQEELEILNRLEAGTLDPSHTVDSISLEDLKFLQGLVKKVYIDEALRQHIINIIWATRHPEGYLTEQQVRVLEYGASPRASIAFFQVAKANALLEGRTYVIPEDVKVLRHEVLRHRLILSYEADVEGIKVEDIIDTLFDSIPIP